MEQDVLYVPERLTFRIIILNLLNSKQECWQRCLNYKDEGVIASRGDVNSDGRINARDTRFIFRYAVGYDEGLEIGKQFRS